MQKTVYDVFVMNSNGWEYWNTYDTPSTVMAAQVYIRDNEWIARYTKRNANEARHVPIN